MSELASHRIEQIAIGEIHTRYPRTVGRNSHLGSHGAGGSQRIVRVRTTDGVTGWGMAATRATAEELVPLLGRRVDDLIDPAVGVIEPAARCLDFALHDLAGHLLQQPAYAVLGGLGEPSVTCYDGAIYFDDLDPEDSPRGVQVALDNCAADHALGFRAFKLKIGRGFRWSEREAGLKRDIEVTRAVREAYPDCRVLVDANNGYTGESFLAYLDAVADCDLFWVEEPFQETREDLTRLRRYLQETGSATLIADGELNPDEEFLLELSRDGLLDVLLMDVISYGLTPWRRIMPTLREIGVQASPHAWGRPLKSLYAAQFAAGLGNVLTVEGVPGTTDGVDTEGYRLVDGVLHVPDTPGFGIPLLTDDLTPVG